MASKSKLLLLLKENIAFGLEVQFSHLFLLLVKCGLPEKNSKMQENQLFIENASKILVSII